MLQCSIQRQESAMLAFDALVRGRVTESSQGMAVVVPRGRCKVETHDGIGIVSLSWTTETGGAESVVLTAQRFEEHLEAGAILIVNAAQICRSLDVRTP
jgi:hypothetical protein